MLEGCEPIGLQFLFDVRVDVVKHFLHVFNGLVDRLLLGHHLLLPPSSHQGGLLDQPHHFLLLLAARDYLLLALGILQNELARADLHLVARCWHLLAFFLVRVVVVLDEQVDASL